MPTIKEQLFIEGNTLAVSQNGHIHYATVESNQSENRVAVYFNRLNMHAVLEQEGCGDWTIYFPDPLNKGYLVTNTLLPLAKVALFV